MLAANTMLLYQGNTVSFCQMSLSPIVPMSSWHLLTWLWDLRLKMCPLTQWFPQVLWHHYGLFELALLTYYKCFLFVFFQTECFFVFFKIVSNCANWNSLIYSFFSLSHWHQTPQRFILHTQCPLYFGQARNGISDSPWDNGWTCKWHEDSWSWKQLKWGFNKRYKL